MTAVKTFLEFREDELNSATIYEALAEIEKDERIREVYQRMASVERKHAQNWENKLLEEGIKPPSYKPGFRIKALIWLAKRFGPEIILPSLQSMEKDGGSAYIKVDDATEMARDEHTHALLLAQIKKTVRGGLEGSALALMEGRHRSTGGNALRAAVLGANDGLVSNLSLVMGVAGATMDNQSILVAGIAGLLAGAFSMALGEWLSVQSSRELYENQVKIEAIEIDQSPDEEAEELALIYEARGIPSDQATQMAQKILQNKASALDTLAREELGIDPEELGGSAWEAAITSFILFAIGAVIPVLPYTFLEGTRAVLFSVIFSVIGLFLLGAAITLFTGRSIWYSGTRMVIFGMLAAAITFGIGKLIGISVMG